MSSYLRFIENKVGELNQYNILELGCGDHSLFEGLNLSNVIAIDKSVDKILSAPQSTINYLAMDMAELTFETKFDLIIDSHALHCIVDFESRDLVYKNIFDSLDEEGQLIAEVMIKKNSSDSYFCFPERIVLSSFEIEEELIKNGFKIIYFSVIPNLYFLDDVSKKNTCDLLRFIAQK